MTVGAIDKLTGTRDVRLLDGLARSQPALLWTACAATASMAAFPLTFGFAAKEAVFDGLLELDPVLIAVATIASILTVAYSIRFLVGAFGASATDSEPATAPKGTPWGLLAPASALALVGIVLGVFPTLPKKLIDLAGASIPGEIDVKLRETLGLLPGAAAAVSEDQGEEEGSAKAK